MASGCVVLRPLQTVVRPLWSPPVELANRLRVQAVVSCVESPVESRAWHQLAPQLQQQLVAVVSVPVRQGLRAVPVD